MDWEPISEEQIWDLMNESYDRMTPKQRILWEKIRVHPHKWKQTPYGVEGGGFWVVGIIGNEIIWFNDIEEGFNRSKYSSYGEFSDYWCNQDELEFVVQNVLSEIQTGEPFGYRVGPPMPIDEK